MPKIDKVLRNSANHIAGKSQGKVRRVKVLFTSRTRAGVFLLILTPWKLISTQFRGRRQGLSSTELRAPSAVTQ